MIRTMILDADLSVPAAPIRLLLLAFTASFMHQIMRLSGRGDKMEDADDAWISFYEKSWASRALLFDKILNEEKNLHRALRLFEAAASGNKADEGNELSSVTDDAIDSLMKRVHSISFGKEIVLSKYHNFSMSLMLADFSKNRDCIIELGSGYGKQLFDIYLNGGPSEARYIAAEPTTSGRDMCNRLSKLEPAMNIASVPFDFNNPDFSHISEFSNILMFTSWSAMFVQPFPFSFFESISSIEGAVTCVFCEPIGFQIQPENTDLQSLVRRVVSEQKFNTDFFSKLIAAQKSCLIDVDLIISDICGSLDDAGTIGSVIVARNMH
ncbi:MAG: hypothetical protein Q7R40_07150 [Phaeospirillum sp.]|nr:hypothetical protein [Phaeospirillum sp.]